MSDYLCHYNAWHSIEIQNKEPNKQLSWCKLTDSEPTCFAKTFDYFYIPMFMYFDIYLSSGYTSQTMKSLIF